MTYKRGYLVRVRGNSIPSEAIYPTATVISSGRDPYWGVFYKVMFNAGTGGVIFKNLLEEEILGCSLSEDSNLYTDFGPEEYIERANIRRWLRESGL